MKKITTQNAPKFYQERNIPKVRWMYPYQAYKARLKTVPYKYQQAIMYIYVLNEEYVIAFRDEAMQIEVGMLKLEHFEKIKDLEDKKVPNYISLDPLSLTLEMVLDTTWYSEVQESSVKVTILPAEPDENYEQLTLIL